jgi:glycosyltransferase involved in cell wall biosynthesis
MKDVSTDEPRMPATRADVSEYFAVIIPAYNEGQTIGDVVRQVREKAAKAEVLVVDDGSSDDTAAAAEEAGAIVIQNPYRLGYGGALKRGIGKSTKPYLVFLDGDGQHLPSDVPRLMKALDESDIVIGVRSGPSASSWTRKPFKLILGWVANFVSGHRIPDLNCGFRAVRKEALIPFLHLMPNGYSFSTSSTLAFLTSGGIVKYVSVASIPREAGNSSVSIWRDGLNTFILVLRIVTLFNPLRVFLPASLGLITVGVVYQLYTLTQIFRIVSGAVLLILSGVIIFFFGLLADQISLMRKGPN